MRFQVGEKIPVVHFVFDGQAPSDFSAKVFRAPFAFFNTNSVSAIRIDELTVVEHHKVPSSYDPDAEKKYDGYILKDSEGNTWRNQYPLVTYAQLVDSADYMFRRAPADGETFEELFRRSDVHVVQYKALGQEVLRLFQDLRMYLHPDYADCGRLQVHSTAQAEKTMSLYGLIKVAFESSPLFEGKTFRIEYWANADSSELPGERFVVINKNTTHRTP